MLIVRFYSPPSLTAPRRRTRIWRPPRRTSGGACSWRTGCRVLSTRLAHPAVPQGGWPQPRRSGSIGRQWDRWCYAFCTSFPIIAGFTVRTLAMCQPMRRAHWRRKRSTTRFSTLTTVLWLQWQSRMIVIVLGYWDFDCFLIPHLLPHSLSLQSPLQARFSCR